MASSDGGARLTLADKINHLFETVVPAGRQPYNTEEVARAITETGIPISGSYIWLLRKGQRDNPTLKHLEGIAKFFGVPPAYFFNDQVASDVHVQLALLAALRDSNVQHVALRAAGLSSASLNSISELIERVRTLEGLSQRTPDKDALGEPQDS
ncbi:helix-turn-helix domain-containing protein [Streptomyces sp. NBC_00190]|uniref:helix-turn-helix domain-containing protein n=1 Tax=unclassified Streptomyces TaxID=2593676 RepID=UPI002E2D715D|nr:helix-turn-helix domain-containing protein [Streptomyces sp. NBC_00190]WSZ43342.1 helix-turn-helix domain-containing protein [Streptomyces sp. NBC_00868]